MLLRLGGARVTTGRALQVGGMLVLLLLGVVLPYLTLEHFDESFAVITETASLRGAGALTGLDATYLPSYNPEIRPDFNVAFNVLGIGPTLQIFGSLVAAVTCWGLFYDEINKFFWWPLHLSELSADGRADPAVHRAEHGARARGQREHRLRLDPGGAGRRPHPGGDPAGPRPDRHLRRRAEP